MDSDRCRVWPDSGGVNSVTSAPTSEADPNPVRAPAWVEGHAGDALIDVRRGGDPVELERWVTGMDAVRRSSYQSR